MATATNSTRARTAHTPAPDTVTEIQRAWRALPRARNEQERTLQRLMAADERRADGEPALPDELRIHPADRTNAVLNNSLQFFVGEDEHGRRSYSCYWTTEMLKAAIADPEPKFSLLHTPPRARLPEALTTRALRLKRALKVARAHDRAIAAWELACGYTAADKLHSEAVAEVRRLEHLIMSTPAQALSDVTVKAELVGWWVKQPDWELYRDARSHCQMLARSIRRDLPRLTR